MTIHLTPEGIFADTEEEKLAFYDRMHAGDPVIMAHIEIWRHLLETQGGEDELTRLEEEVWPKTL